MGKDCRILPNGIIEISTHQVTYEIPEKAKKHLSKLNWLAGSKRKKFTEFLRKEKKYPRTNIAKIVLTETFQIRLPKNVAMFFISSSDGGSSHLHSTLIDPGFQGPIVMEIKGYVQNRKPDMVLAYLARA